MGRRLVVGLVVLGLVTAAGANTAGDVALFFNPTYVDTSAPPGGEASTLQASLLSLNYSVSTFTGITANDINTAVSGKSVLAIPELEKQDLSPDLSFSARAAIASFVGNQAGTLLVFAPGSGDPLAVLNGAFGYSMTAADIIGPISLNATAASGTAFEGGPATLAVNNATTAVLASSLPIGAKVIYADANGNAVVTLIAPDPDVVGGGNIVIMGWDWFDAMPAGNQDGGWLDALNRGASIRGLAPAQAIPTLSEWALIAMAAMLLLLGLRRLHQTRSAG